MIPQSLLRAGYKTMDEVLHSHGRTYPMTIGLDGKPSEGKTELALSAPGVIAAVTVDRGHLGLMLNPKPPATRCKDVVWRVIDPPMPTAAVQNEFSTYWAMIRESMYNAAKMPEIRTVLADGDSDTWEIQRMAEFGKLSQVPSHLYTAVNAARRAYYAKLTDFGKFLIFTSKMTKEYRPVYRPDGTPELDNQGKPVRRWTGNWERKGFDDIDYSLQLSLNCFRVDAKYDADGNLLEAGEFAARLELCKSNRSLEGTEFVGADCNFQSILPYCYPHVKLADWGY